MFRHSHFVSSLTRFRRTGISLQESGHSLLSAGGTGYLCGYFTTTNNKRRNFSCTSSPHQHPLWYFSQTLPVARILSFFAPTIIIASLQRNISVWTFPLKPKVYKNSLKNSAPTSREQKALTSRNLPLSLFIKTIVTWLQESWETHKFNFGGQSAMVPNVTARATNNTHQWIER